MVQTQDTAVSEVVNQRRIIDLPLNGRQATDLILLAGGTTKVPTASFGGANALVTTKNYPGSAAVSVGGGQATGNNYVMDGADNNDTFSNVNLPFPFPDALQEFSVQTNGLSAQFGIHPGTVVNVVTKSGTNQIHGDLFEFVRNGDFNARNFFAATQDTLRRNQFGGTVGAPIKKDKLFGFFGYQRTCVRTAPPQSISFVPTDAARNGDFSGLESAACQSTRTHRAITDPDYRPAVSERPGPRQPLQPAGAESRQVSAARPTVHAARSPTPFRTPATRASISAAWTGTRAPRTPSSPATSC